MPDPHNLPAVIANQSPTYRTFMVHALEPEGDHGLVGRANVGNVVRGAFHSASIGYDAYDPYVGQGALRRGAPDHPRHRLRRRAPGHGVAPGRSQHPAGERSIRRPRPVTRLRPRGFSKDFLHLPGHDGRRAWRDHDRYTMLSSDWPAVPYRHATDVDSWPSSRGRRPWRRPGSHRSWPSSSACRSTPHPRWRRWRPFRAAAQPPIGGVVEGKLAGPELRMGLARAGVDPAVAPVFDAMEDASKRDVVDRALRVRAAFATHER